MSSNPHLLTPGVDHLSLDKRNFDPSRDEIEDICRFFSLEKLLRYEKEKGVVISHSNFFVFAATAKGQYALKFYPQDKGRHITVEYAVNRLLIKHHFPTPLMHAGRGSRPFVTGKNGTVACFDYIEAKPAWQRIRQPDTIRRINTALLSLKNILSAGVRHLPSQKQADLLSNTTALAKDSRALGVYDQKELIERSLREACKTYQRYRVLFTRQRVHNNASLTNFLIDKKTIYTLDLSHIREDYVLSDLASMVISCLFFNMPAAMVKTIARNYFTVHKMDQEYFPVLNTLVRTGLIREYLKNIQRERSVALSASAAGLARTYSAHLAKRKKLITGVLKKMNNDPRLIV